MPGSNGARMTAVALGALLVFSCTASNPAPQKWRRSVKTSQESPFGAWIIIKLGSGPRIEGELLAVGKRELVVSRGGKPARIARSRVREATLVAYTADNSGLLAGVVLGTLSTLSHGFALVLSAPIWMLAGGGTARAHSARGFLTSRQGLGSLDEFRKWARFPQGTPRHFMGSKRRRPRRSKSASEPVQRGRLGTACYPNQTCDRGLVCGAGRAPLCVEPPELGTSGGRCFANQSCRDGLVCADGVCGPAPAAEPAPADDGGAAPDPPTAAPLPDAASGDSRP